MLLLNKGLLKYIVCFSNLQVKNHQDNQRTIAMADNPIQDGRTKDIDLR
jgi:hypothetical protein